MNTNRFFALRAKGLRYVPIRADQHNYKVRRSSKTPNYKANYWMLTYYICLFISKGKCYINQLPHRLEIRQSLGRSISS